MRTIRKSNSCIGYSLALLLSLALLSSAVPLSAADDYPSKPITLIVAFRAGGTVDTVSRTLAKPLSEILGQPVVVKNKPGGAGRMAYTQILKDKPDGYTLAMGGTSPIDLDTLATKGVTYKKEDFSYISTISLGQFCIISKSDKPWKNWQEFIAYAKKNPGMTWASQSTADKLFLRYVGKKENIDWNPMAVKGGSKMIPMVLGNHVDFAFSGGIHYSYVKAGEMKVLAAFSKEKLAAFPDVPSFLELGYGIAMNDMVAMVGPGGMPPEIVAKLSNAVGEAVKDKRVVELLNNKMHIPPYYKESEEFKALIFQQYEDNKKLLDALEK